MFLCISRNRDLLETRQICETIGGELKRKENAIKELQQRLESNEGCEYNALVVKAFYFF